MNTSKAEFRSVHSSYNEKTHVFSTQTLWTDKALEVDARVWWDYYYWGSRKKVLHDSDFRVATRVRVTSQPASIDSAERCWKVYANINCAKRNRLGPERAAIRRAVSLCFYAVHWTFPGDSERLCTQDFSGFRESHYPCQWMLIVQEPEGASGLWFQAKVWDTLHARMIPNLTATSGSQAAS